MKCMNCGADIPEDQLICPGCGQEIQIVPDYNPLDDVLAAQVRGAVTQTLETAARQPMQGRTGGARSNTGRTGGTRYNTDKYSERYSERNSGRNQGRRPGRGNAGRISPEEREFRHRQAEKKRMMAKKRKQKKLMLLLSAVVLAIIIGIVCYMNSYTGQLKKGYRLLEAGSYNEAVTHFQKAVRKDRNRSDAYTGLSKVYIAQSDLEKAEKVFLSAISEQGSNLELYRAAIAFYVDTRQESKVTVLLDKCSSEKVLTELAAYISDEPKFSLDDTKIYDEIQALELTGNGKAIYYTTDKTDPTVSSTKYTEPIKLDEGVTEVRVISVNDKGIPSRVVTKTYTVEFPIADAPVVSPPTGQYEELRYIEVTVPDNYEAYYTMDGTDPDPANNPRSTHKYTGPIKMPVGNTIFSVALADQNGRLSDITKRTYERIDTEEE